MLPMKRLILYLSLINLQLRALESRDRIHITAVVTS